MSHRPIRESAPSPEAPSAVSKRSIHAANPTGCEQRVAEVMGGKTPGKVTRPPNSFMLYRSAYYARAASLSHLQQQITSIVAISWKIETAVVQMRFALLAEIEKARHKEAFPDFKFGTRTLTTRKANDVVQGEGGDKDETEGENGTEDEIVIPPTGARRAAAVSLDTPLPSNNAQVPVHHAPPPVPRNNTPVPTNNAPPLPRNSTALPVNNAPPAKGSENLDIQIQMCDDKVARLMRELEKAIDQRDNLQQIKASSRVLNNAPVQRPFPVPVDPRLTSRQSVYPPIPGGSAYQSQVPVSGDAPVADMGPLDMSTLDVSPEAITRLFPGLSPDAVGTGFGDWTNGGSNGNRAPARRAETRAEDGARELLAGINGLSATVASSRQMLRDSRDRLSRLTPP
ncbi:hypothetical protein OQA88_7469 [Cercophora sp. LCS_1]